MLPVSESVAFRYANALNWLLQQRGGKTQKAGDTASTIGDSTAVFWTEEASSAEALFVYLLGGEPREGLEAKLQDRLAVAPRQDRPWDVRTSDLGRPETPFYLLGLSPNASRLAVPLLARRYPQGIARAPASPFRGPRNRSGAQGSPHPPVWRILAETAREMKDVPPLLGGAMIRAVLGGQGLPV